MCQGVQERQAPDREGNLRRAYVFELRRLEAIEAVVETTTTSLTASDLPTLRAKALAAISPTPTTRMTSGSIFDRSRAIRDYVLARAGRYCEGCEQHAPFKRSDGSPYLEAHHVRRLSDGGPDHPAYVIGLCPNCHRRIYAGQDGTDSTGQIAHARGRRLERRPGMQRSSPPHQRRVRHRSEWACRR